MKRKHAYGSGGGTIPTVMTKALVNWLTKSSVRISVFILATFALFAFTMNRTPSLCPQRVHIEEDEAEFIAKHYGCHGHVEHRAKIYQISNHANTSLARASEVRDDFDRVMNKIIDKIPGARYYGSRVKGNKRLLEKLDSWRTADKIADYLGCRVTVKSHSALRRVLVKLGSRFDVVQHEDFLDGHAFKTGYRAIHTQLLGRRLDQLGGEEYWRAW